MVFLKRNIVTFRLRYSAGEFEEILSDIAFCRAEAVDCVSCGFLLRDGSIDHLRLAIAVQAAEPMRFIFNRAFDVSNDLLQSLLVLIRCGCAAVLTSAGEATAFQGRGMLSQLVHASAGRISVVAAAGINAACAADVVAAIAPPSASLPVAADNSAFTVWLHMSGSAVVPTAADPELKYASALWLYWWHGRVFLLQCCC
jgi:copper homeostasis protein CutC